MMDQKKRKRLEAHGWKFGTAAEFLELTPQEAQYVELKLKLSNALRDRRKRLGLSQKQLAKDMSSSQSRVAKMEADDPSVSIDLLIRGLIATGAGPETLSTILYPRNRVTPKAT